MATAQTNGPDGQPLKAQKIALNLIKADDALQPRMGRDPEHQQRMARAYEEGEEIPPAVHLYYDGKFYWLVDGFHRFHAMWSLRKKAEKFNHIKAFVHHGTKEEAIAYAAVANLDSRSKPMTDEDRKKAMWMLMDLPEWRDKAGSFIGKKFNLAAAVGRRYWMEYYETRGLALPETVVTGSGRNIPTFTKTTNNQFRPKLTSHPNTNGKGKTLKASIEGKVVCLGSDKNKAQEKLDSMLETIELRRRKYEYATSMKVDIERRGYICRNIYEKRQRGGDGLYARSVNGIAVTWEPFRDKSAAPAAFGRAMHAKATIGASRAVVLCPVEDGPKDVMEDYRKAYGVEWMTIEEFIESLKGEAGK